VKSLFACGIEQWYVERGSGPTLLLVHGFPLDNTMWAQQIDVLAASCRVIAPDLRGFGRTGGKVDDKVTMEQFADDLASLLDALGVGEPVVFCGLSMGGYIAFQFWRRHTERLRGLILCDTRAVSDTPEAADGRIVMADRVLRNGPGPLVEAMLPRLFSEGTRRGRPELIDRVRQTMMATDRRAIAAALRGMAERPDMTAALGQIRCPTLVVVGAEDATSTPAEMQGLARSIPGATFVEVRGAGHLSPAEDPAAVNAAMHGFLANLRGA
jgi:3-oxoadipate enol-lactonase